MALVTGGMGGLGSICAFICAQEGLGPIMTTSRTGALPGARAQLNLMEGIMQYTPHISLKCDMSQSNVVADVLQWIQKMGKVGLQMEQQVVNIDEISNTLRYQMGFSEKRKSSLKSTLELMMWIRDRYAKALAQLKKKAEAGDTGGQTKKEMEDSMLNLQENEVKVGELIGDIRKKLNLPEGRTASETSLRQVRQKAAQLSQTVADLEEMSNPVRKASFEMPSAQPHKQQSDEARQWVVVGGVNNGGIVVQLGNEAQAEDCDQRLATGATVQELKMEDGKILFKKIAGEGPPCGWASLAQNGEPLLLEANETELE